MGFYDARCMITGVSLKGSETALVLLQQTAAAYHPIALAITGQYDRLGSIDGVDEDENTALVLRFFLNQLETKALVIDEEYLRIRGSFPIETTEHLLRGFERNINDNPTAAVLNGQPVVFALIAVPVWNAIAREGKASTDDRAAFRKLFNSAPIPEAIYGEHLEDVSQHLQEFVAVDSFLTKRKIPWTPETDAYQHYSDDMRQFLTDARAAFKGSELVLKGLKAYENEVSDLLEN